MHNRKFHNNSKHKINSNNNNNTKNNKPPTANSSIENNILFSPVNDSTIVSNFDNYSVNNIQTCISSPLNNTKNLYGSSKSNNPTIKTISTNSSDIINTQSESSNESKQQQLDKNFNLYHNVNEEIIIAPNIDRLSTKSVVLINLKATLGQQAILCSIDILKMKSTYFHELLNDESNVRNCSINSKISQCESPIHSLDIPCNNSININIDEDYPFDAIAFLESLHDTRILFKGDWNSCWAVLRYNQYLIILYN